MAETTEKHTHEHHHHSHHSHHHHSHHRHHGGSNRTRSTHSIFHGDGSFKERFFRMLSSHERSSNTASKLSKTANSRSNKKVSKYYTISRRVMFCLIIFGVISVAVYNIISEDTDAGQQMAAYTPSETTQLKRQVSSLQAQVDSLTEELAKYKEKFGELQE